MSPGEYRRLVVVYVTPSHVDNAAGATEAFFETPVLLANAHPELYGVLTRYYLQDPAKARAARGHVVL